MWMNAGAYGSDFSAVLERALVATADGSGWLTPAELGLSYRHSELRHGQVVLESRAAAAAAAERGDPCGGARAQRAPQGRAADEQAHVRSVFKNPDHELSAGRMLDACGLGVT